jgi:hypothetical protein
MIPNIRGLFGKLDPYLGLAVRVAIELCFKNS